MKEQNSHIVVKNNGYYCQSCQEFQEINTENFIVIFVTDAWAFLEKHKNCQEKFSEKEVGDA